MCSVESTDMIHYSDCRCLPQVWENLEGERVSAHAFFVISIMCECSSINPRPTLNQYIELFETGKKIENERYNIIFKRLFSDRSVSKELFNQKMRAVKFLLEREKNMILEIWIQERQI